jgi:NAD+ synthetase
MRVALAQTNPTVGDVEGNVERMLTAFHQAESQGANIIVFPELSVLGYPPRDLVLRPDIVSRCAAAVEAIALECRLAVAIVGTVSKNQTGHGQPLFNSAMVCANGRVHSVHHKTLLPSYDVFDERRYFEPANETVPTAVWVEGREIRLGVCICEDLWHDAWGQNKPYDHDPVNDLTHHGVDMLINIAASPFWVGKQLQRLDIFKRRARTAGCPIVYVNQVGGNDELLFDGGSVVVDGSGAVVAQAPAFESAVTVIDLNDSMGRQIKHYPGATDSILQALVMGTRDYVNKCGFDEVVIGLSGGIDSTVTAALAVLALGSERVHGVAMPSRFSSAHSMTDAQALATALGIDFRIIGIDTMHSAAEQTLAAHFGDGPTGVAEENLQARIRGQILMGLSNKFGWLVLSTGNKSELAVGYCTLYGDMCGGLNVISDVAKTMIYDLARRLNEHYPGTIPENVITKPPSAELRPEQFDQDTLPPYEILDDILVQYVEQGCSAGEIIAKGGDAKLVHRIVQMVNRNEYKRRQASPGLKITSTAFGMGRRMPVAARLD